MIKSSVSETRQYLASGGQKNNNPTNSKQLHQIFVCKANLLPYYERTISACFCPSSQSLVVLFEVVQDLSFGHTTRLSAPFRHLGQFCFQVRTRLIHLKPAAIPVRLILVILVGGWWHAAVAGRWEHLGVLGQ